MDFHDACHRVLGIAILESSSHPSIVGQISGEILSTKLAYPMILFSSYPDPYMILTGTKITEEVELGNITLDPFEIQLVNPNSYNYRLGETLLLVDEDEIDLRKEPQIQTILIPEEGYVLQPRRFYLGYTLETIGSDKYIPSLIGRSSLGRLGLFLQITADLGHLGTCHKWTLELTSVQPIVVYAGMRIGQVSFWVPDGLDLLKDKYGRSGENYARFSTPQKSITSKLLE